MPNTVVPNTHFDNSRFQDIAPNRNVKKVVHGFTPSNSAANSSEADSVYYKFETINGVLHMVEYINFNEDNVRMTVKNRVDYFKHNLGWNPTGVPKINISTTFNGKTNTVTHTPASIRNAEGMNRGINDYIHKYGTFMGLHYPHVMQEMVNQTIQRFNAGGGGLSTSQYITVHEFNNIAIRNEASITFSKGIYGSNSVTNIGNNYISINNSLNREIHNIPGNIPHLQRIGNRLKNINLKGNVKMELSNGELVSIPIINSNNLYDTGINSNISIENGTLVYTNRFLNPSRFRRDIYCTISYTVNDIYRPDDTNDSIFNNITTIKLHPTEKMLFNNYEIYYTEDYDTNIEVSTIKIYIKEVNDTFDVLSTFRNIEHEKGNNLMIREVKFI